MSFSRLGKIKKVMQINQVIVGHGKSRKFIVCQGRLITANVKSRTK